MNVVVNAADVVIDDHLASDNSEAEFSVVTSSKLQVTDTVVKFHKVNQTEKSASDESISGLRVTFVNRYFYPDMSATSQMLFDLARRLVKHGVEVNVVCSRQLYNDAHAKLSSFQTVEGIKVYRVATTLFGRSRLCGRALDYLSFYVTATQKLLSLTSRGDILVAKTDPPLISLAVATVAKLKGARLVNWIQDLFPEVATHLGQPMPRWLGVTLESLRDLSLRMASANVVIGERMKCYVMQRQVAAEKIHVVQNWADGQYLEPMPANSSVMRISLGLQKKFVVGYSGNLGRAHEFETILCAAQALRNEADVVFLMIGGGINMQQLKTQVALHKLGNFIFMPYQPRELLADSMAAADVHLISLLPSLEGFIVPSKFYGILATGRPAIVIGDTDGELARVIRREKCGEAVRVGDWDALVSAIWLMKQEPEYRQQLGARARTIFLGNYTADQGARKWVELFVELLRIDFEKRPGAVTVVA
ncbi:MAG: glycosyltransferase family 4 protein [Steroidobacteraceae bacterium]